MKDIKKQSLVDRLLGRLPKHVDLAEASAVDVAELEHVTGGRPPIGGGGGLATCPTCSDGVEDDCGYDPFG